MSKHTQSPWTAKKTAMKDTYWILDSNGGMVAKTELNPADAMLVAAAPELLEAVTYLLTNADLSNLTGTQIEWIRSITKKAKGK